MTPVRRFFRLSIREQWLLVRAAVLLAGVRAGLAFLPLWTVRRALWCAVVATGWRSRIPDEGGRCVWAVEVAARQGPAGATCLTKALVAQTLLQNVNIPATLHIGVAGVFHGRPQAHAWVESGGQVVVGRVPDLEAYHVLLRTDAVSA